MLKKFAFLFVLALLSNHLVAWNSPAITSPLAGASVWTGITLNWGSVTGSKAYQIQFDLSASFNSPALKSFTKNYINSAGSNSDTEHFANELLFGRTYYWRVRAYIAGDTSAWTESNFTTRDFVTQSTPGDEADTWTGITLNWSPHTGVSFYDVEADTVASFNSPAYRSASKAYVNSSDGNSDTEHFLNNLFFGKRYYWRVRARNTVDTSSWSAQRTFTTRDFVTQSTPGDEADTWTGITLNWSPHTGVSFYDVEADTVASFNSPAYRSASKAYVNSSDGNSDTEHFLNNLFFGKRYYWRVRARNTLDTSSWSAQRTFTTRDFVTQSTPGDEADTWTGITLNWSPHTGVSFYDVEADTVASFNSPAYRSASKAYVNSSDGNSDTEHFLNNLFFGKRYYWRVRARNTVDTSSWSAQRTFTTRDFVTQSTPGDEADTWTGITLNWSPHTGVSFYDVEADTVASFNSPAYRSASKAYVNSSDGNSDTEHFLNNLFFGKRYYWRVRARNAVDTSGWSGNRTFTTRNFVNLTSPADATLGLNLNTTVNWAPHTGIAVYQLQVDVTNLFNSGSLINVNQNYVNSSDGNSDTQRSLTNLQPNTVYFWRVRAINAVDTSAWTQRWFSTGNAPVVLPPSPVQLIPCGGSIGTINTAALSWQAVPNAGTYEVELRASGLPFSGNPTGNANGTNFQANGLFANTGYCWRVRSVVGNLASEWSSSCCFITSGSSSISVPQTNKQIYCSGESIQVQYSLSGIFNQGNIFTLQLSDPSGNFNNPFNIGSFPGTNPGTLNATIPLPSLEGSSYKVRVISSNPSLQSPASGSFTVNPAPQVVTSLNLSICAGSGPVQLEDGEPAGGIWVGSGISNNTFDPQISGTGLFFPVYTYTSANGCSGSDQGQILVDNCTSIDFSSAKSGWKVFYNGYHLVLATPSDLLDINGLEAQWYDLTGRLIHRSAITGTTDDLKPEKAGLYLLRVAGDGGRILFQDKIWLPQ
jgi:hypothetical protein